MQAIQTKILSATNTKGTRVKAWCQARAITRSTGQVSESLQDYQRTVALELADSLDWLDNCDIESGWLPNGDGCHVLVRKLGNKFDIIEKMIDELQTLTDPENSKQYFKLESEVKQLLKGLLEDQDAMNKLSRDQLVKLIRWSNSYRPSTLIGLMMSFGKIKTQ